MSRNTCVALLALLCLLCVHSGKTQDVPDPPGGTKCTPVEGSPGCVCDHPNGRIDLTSLANEDNTPKFMEGLIDTNNFQYWFNPCHTFNSLDGCSDVFICQQAADGGEFFDIADGDEQIRINGTETYLYYTGPQARDTRVYLNCAPTATDTQVTTEGDSVKTLSYVFYVTSAAVCPSGGGGGGGGDVAGPIGLVIIFVCIVAVVAYFVVGAIIMKVKFQATGTDIIPNKALWFDLPLLIKDGFVFTFSPCIQLIKAKSSGYQKA